MQAQVVGAALHVGGGERHAERIAQRGNVLEEDLLLEVLRAGRDQHALAAEDGGHEIGERLAGAGAGFGEQDAAVVERAGDRVGHLDLAGARLEAGQRAGQRAAGREGLRDGLVERMSTHGRASRQACSSPDTAGTSGTAARPRLGPCASAASSSGVLSARAMSSPMMSISGFAHAARGHRRRADADAAGDHRRILIERNRVLVDRDARLAERRFGDLAGDAFREHVHEHQMIVGAAADQPEAGAGRGPPARRAALATICR